MTTNSTWVALRNPAFRKLWIAAVISGTCVTVHDSAATWMMNIFSGSPLWLSLMSTVASLPFFLFTLPAGALADKVDRQKLVCTINVCLAATAFPLALLGWMDLLHPTSSWVACFASELGLRLTHRPGRRSCLKSSQRLSCLLQRP
jgi:MFS family permease